MNHDAERETGFRKKKEIETGLARAHVECFVMTPADPH